MNNLGIFDIVANGVLLHSRKCETRSYGVPGHLWLRDVPARQNAVWQGITSAITLPHSQALKHAHQALVVIRSSTYGQTHSADVAKLIAGWFQTDRLCIQEVTDDSSEWNFEITVNGVLLHSRNKLGHDFFLEDASQQTLVWRAIVDLCMPDARDSDCK